MSLVYPCSYYQSLTVLVLDYVHHVNPETPIEQTMRALVELKK